MSALKTSVEIAMLGSARHHPIPPITSPLGDSWDQPDRFEIEIDDTHAMMSQATFDKILDYTCSQPTGVYPGKMFKKGNRLPSEEWWLHWFGEHSDPRLCSNHVRKILIV